MWLKYCKDLAKHTLNIHSAISFALIFVVPFLPVSNSVKTSLAIVFAILALLIASYHSWRDLYKKIEGGSFDILSEYSSFGCGSVDGAGMINKYSSVIFNIDFMNSTDQPQFVKKMVGVNIKGDYGLFGSKIDKILFREANNPQQEVLLPIKIAPKDRRMLKVSISIPVLESKPENLPSILSKLKKLEISVLFAVSNQKGESTEEEAFLEVDAKEYTDEIVRIWKQHGCPELYEVYCNEIA